MVYNPSKAIHPGHAILHVLEREGMTQKNLSERTGLTEKHLSQVINGEASITVETALLLENALGGSASFWINLEKNFQETNARIERSALVKKEVSLLKNFPYDGLAKRGYVEQTSNKEKRVEGLWKFFGVNSLLSVRNTEDVAFRKRPSPKIKSEPIATWLRCGELESKKSILPEFSETLLRQSLQKIKAITLDLTGEFSVKLRETLAQCGVALVYVPHFPGTGVNGAVRWVNDVPIIQLSLFGSRADIFWFNTFHEIGHLLLHGKKEKFIEFDDHNLSIAQDKEEQANKFATDELIPRDDYNNFIKIGNFSKDAVVKFAEKIGVHPGIVTGRLCHDKLVKWSNASKLRVLLEFKK